MNIGELKVSAIIETGMLKSGGDETVQKVQQISTEYDKLSAKMKLYEDAGKKNTLAYKMMQKEQQALIADLNRLGNEYDKTEKKSSLFRQKNLNLARDLTVIGHGIRAAISDFRALSNELNSTNMSMGNVAESAANAGSSILFIIPALTALKNALPASFASALPVIGSVTAALAGMYIFVTKFKDQLPALGRAFRFLSGEISFDEGVAEFERLQGAITDTSKLMDHLRYQMGQFKNVEKGLDINSPTLSEDIRKKYENSSQGFEEYYKKVKNGTATIYEANIVLNKLEERRTKVTGENLSLINQTIEATKKYVETQNSFGVTDTKSPTGSPSVNRIEEEKKKLNEVEQTQERINELTNEYNDAMASGYMGLAEELKVQIDEMEKRMEFLVTGIKEMDISGKIGDLDALSTKLAELPDDPSFVKAGKPFTGSKQSGPAEEPTGLDLGAMVQVAQNIHNILNQPLDNPFKIMQAMLQIAMQIGTLLGGAGGMGAGGGLLSFLGPIGGIVNLVGGIFGGLLGMPKSGSAGGGGMSENMKKMADMFNTFRATGSIYNLPREFTQVAPANVNVNNGYGIYINGKKIDNKFKKEVVTDGLIIKDFYSRTRTSA